MNAVVDENSIEANVNAILERTGIIYSVRYIGETIENTYNGRSWACDRWEVKFSKSGAASETFDYYTGVGLRKKPITIPRPVKPDAATVLHSLTLDAEASDMSFDDWCDNFGYSSDSIKDLNVYRECCAIGKRLNRLMGRKAVQEFSEAVREL